MVFKGDGCPLPLHRKGRVFIVMRENSQKEEKKLV